MVLKGFKDFGIAAALAFATAFATLAPAPAQAATYVFDLLNPTSTSPGSGPSCGTTSGAPACGNSKTYSQGTGGSQLQVQATAWSIYTTPNPDVVTNAYLGSYTSSNPLQGGLGVTNQGEASSVPNHSVDNSSYRFDFVLFQFDREVDLNSFYDGWVYSTVPDADATIRYGDLGIAWNTTPAWNNQSVSAPGGLDALMAGSLNSDVTTASIGWRSVNPDNILSKTWIIGALYPDKIGTDYFKLKKLNVTAYPPVPEPATWLMMIAGFGAIGWTMRRRRSIAAAQNEAAA